MKLLDLFRSAENCEAEYGVLGLTIYVAETPRIDDLVDQAGIFVQRYRTLNVCSLAVLIEDYEVVPTKQSPHYTVVLPSATSDELEKVRRCFLAIDNPLFRG